MLVGILGGGQLARMLALAGYPLGLRFRIYDAVAESPAEHVAEYVQGEFTDEGKLAEFARGLDVVTYEFENVPVAAVELLAKTVRVYPPPLALGIAQDRLAEKQLFRRLGIPTPRFCAIDRLADCMEAVSQVGLPAVLKTRHGGYDGKGQFVLECEKDARELDPRLEGRPLIVEAFVPFDREVSMIAVRNSYGLCDYYPLVQNRHAGGILRESRAPAEQKDLSDWGEHVGRVLAEQAQGYARSILEHTNYVGVLAVEFFESQGQLLANEMAPRVHNSGHWTIEGTATSQFENHLRAILNMPLGGTTPIGVSAMFNLIGTVPNVYRLLDVAEAHVHLYGKTPRPGRKLGHVTVCAANDADLVPRLEAVRALVAAGES